jgi:hypothetical protein
MAVNWMRTNSAATVYNKYIQSGAEKYHRATISNVAWENRKAANVIRSGLLEADSVNVYIPFAMGADYLKPKAWQALISKTGKWTLQVGDVMVKGIVSDEIGVSFTISDLKAKYDDVVVIHSVDTMDNCSANLQHWQVGAG